MQETINQLRVVADEDLSQAGRLDAPDAMKSAQSDLELLLSLRRDGVANVADEIQTALGGTAGAGTAVDAIAGQMQAFNASDVIYSQRVAPLILKGLKDDGIAASYDGTAGEQVLPYADFLPDISWMSPDFVAQQLGASSASSRTTRHPRARPARPPDRLRQRQRRRSHDRRLEPHPRQPAADVRRQLHERRRERRDERQSDGRDHRHRHAASERRRSFRTRPPAKPRPPT